MTEMEKINQMCDESTMDYVDEPDNAPKKEGRIKRLVKKAKPVAANAAKNIGKMALEGTLAGVVAAGGVTLVAKLTGREICLIPEGSRDQINEICREAFTHVKDNAADVVEAAKDAVEETIDA